MNTVSSHYVPPTVQLLGNAGAGYGTGNILVRSLRHSNGRRQRPVAMAALLPGNILGEGVPTLPWARREASTQTPAGDWWLSIKEIHRDSQTGIKVRDCDLFGRPEKGWRGQWRSDEHAMDEINDIDMSHVGESSKNELDMFLQTEKLAQLKSYSSGRTWAGFSSATASANRRHAEFRSPHKTSDIIKQLAV